MEARARRLGLQHGNSVESTKLPSCVLVEGTNMSWRSAERRLCPVSDASDWDADVVKVARTVLTDAVKRRDCYFKLYSLRHREPMKHVAKSRRDVFVFANTNDQTGSSVQNHRSRRMTCEETPYRTPLQSTRLAMNVATSSQGSPGV